MRRNGCAPEEPEALGDLRAKRRMFAIARLLERRPHREQRERREGVRDRVEEKRQRRGRARRARRRGAGRRAAPSRAGPPARRRRRRAAPPGQPLAARPACAALNTVEPVPSTNATTSDCPDRRMAGEDRCGQHRDRRGAHGVRGDHQVLAVPPVGGDAGEQPEQPERRQSRERDEPRLRRRVRQREHQQRVRNRRRLRTGGREELPRLQQDEVAVAP